MLANSFSSAQNQIFEALPEGLPLPLEATSALSKKGEEPHPTTNNAEEANNANL